MVQKQKHSVNDGCVYPVFILTAVNREYYRILHNKEKLTGVFLNVYHYFFSIYLFTCCYLRMCVCDQKAPSLLLLLHNLAESYSKSITAVTDTELSASNSVLYNLNTPESYRNSESSDFVFLNAFTIT